ncbi:1120_t:CDS:10 [Paraglomus brasilianum]|uniref:Large ribosomal subunit protein mL44 n=1 Tax=Paraglomus brasilianum TaxID=144538 RepID=A0A9N9F076_9GLOM|nr:1120_t:CDS:10 [Paraglomus brasilianum]
MSVSKSLRREYWTKEEDKALRKLHHELGPVWIKISINMVTKTPKQCYERWNNATRPGINSDPLNDEERAMIDLLYCDYGPKWSVIASHIPGRTARIQFLRIPSLSLTRSFHNSSPRYVIKPKFKIPISPDPPVRDSIPAGMHALGARLNLKFSNQKILLQALTDRTYVDTDLPSNEGFQVLGNNAFGLYVTEYLHVKYPRLPLPILEEILTMYCGHTTLSTFGREVGVDRQVRWQKVTDEALATQSANGNEKRWVPESNTPRGIGKVTADAVGAIVGALYFDQGPAAAKSFIHDQFLSRDVNVGAIFERHIVNPKRDLSYLMRRHSQEPPISRLTAETGRLSKSPTFIVSVYSGTKKLGEGFGSSLDMAEFRAARDALKKHYLKETKDFQLPSIVDKENVVYVPTEIEDTPAIV